MCIHVGGVDEGMMENVRYITIFFHFPLWEPSCVWVESEEKVKGLKVAGTSSLVFGYSVFYAFLCKKTIMM